MVAIFLFAPSFSSAQSCIGICINIIPSGDPGSGGGGSGASGAISPSNLHVEINGGDSCASSREVTLTLEFSNVTTVNISNDEDFSEGDWGVLEGSSDPENPIRGQNREIIRTAQIPWTLTRGDEVKEVFVIFRSSSRNASNVYSDTILLDESTDCEFVPPETEEPDDSENVDDVSPGDYIRGFNRSTIYFIEQDGTRRPFLNETIYFTHHPTFGPVEFVTDQTLVRIDLGFPMLPKPGTILVKLPEDPKVYYIENDPLNIQSEVLRWIENEELAESIFGTEWRNYLIDLDPVLFPRFVIGDSISTTEPISSAGLIHKVQLDANKFTNDFDSDGLTDYLEAVFGSDPTNPDEDNDGLLDGGEYRYATSPTNPDTDGDGFLDGDEVSRGFDPLGPGVLDSDGDGLSDPDEFFYQTDRYLADTDGDGFDDKTEVDHGFNPNGPGLMPRTVSNFTTTRYILSAFDLAIFRIRNLLPF